MGKFLSNLGLWQSLLKINQKPKRNTNFNAEKYFNFTKINMSIVIKLMINLKKFTAEIKQKAIFWDMKMSYESIRPATQNKSLQRCPASCIIKNMRIRIKLRCPFSVMLAKIKQVKNNVLAKMRKHNLSQHNKMVSYRASQCIHS